MYKIKILKCLEPSGSNIRPTDSQVLIEKQTKNMVVTACRFVKMAADATRVSNLAHTNDFAVCGKENAGGQNLGEAVVAVDW